MHEDHSDHLVILNSQHYDLLLHFNLPKDDKLEQDNDNYNNVDNRKPLVNIVCREAFDSKELTELKLQFAADLVRTIGYWLWQKD